MIPAVSPAGAATGQPVANLSANKAVQAAAPEAARASAGETAASNVKLATSSAVTAPDQSAVAPRLRDQETSERSERALPGKDAPTGPPPSFEESPLERQARVAFDPPEQPVEPAFDLRPDVEVVEKQTSSNDEGTLEVVTAEAPADPPPTPSERAEASFAETRTLSEPKEAAQVDVAR